MRMHHQSIHEGKGSPVQPIVDKILVTVVEHNSRGFDDWSILVRLDVSQLRQNASRRAHGFQSFPSSMSVDQQGWPHHFRF